MVCRLEGATEQALLCAWLLPCWLKGRACACVALPQEEEAKRKRDEFEAAKREAHQKAREYEGARAQVERRSLPPAA
jgi:hypothetical protein